MTSATEAARREAAGLTRRKKPRHGWTSLGLMNSGCTASFCSGLTSGFRADPARMAQAARLATEYA